jgi:hypothetical protein
MILKRDSRSIMSKLAKFKRQPTGSSVPREFNRPIEFDQSLADRHVQVVVSSPARASLSMQLGLGTCILYFECAVLHFALNL